MFALWEFLSSTMEASAVHSVWETQVQYQAITVTEHQQWLLVGEFLKVHTVAPPGPARTGWSPPQRASTGGSSHRPTRARGRLAAEYRNHSNRPRPPPSLRTLVTAGLAAADRSG
jgi:hypothetical protein